MKLSLENDPSTNSCITIRPALIKDLNGIVEVLITSFYPTKGLFFWLYPLYRLGIYEDLRNRIQGNRPYYLCLVATLSDDTVVATVEIALRPAHAFDIIGAKYPYISNLAVKQAYRRRGIAGKLLTRCEHIAWEWGYRKLGLHVLADNYQARQLYLSRGYQVDKVDLNIEDWLFNRPKRLLMVKSY